jgi:hypothetical protein
MAEQLCSVCFKPVEEHNHSYLVMFEKDEIRYWKWACEHHPCPEAIELLGSASCAMAWLGIHPEDAECINQLFLQRIEMMMGRRRSANN